MTRVFKFLVLFWVLSGAQAALAAPIAAGSFSTTWDTDTDTEVTINLGTCGDNGISYYWEEIGNAANNDTDLCLSDDMTITFPSPGQYRIDFSGTFESIDLGDQANRDKFRTVEQWGDTSWTNLSGAFQNVPNLVFNATDVPDLSQVTVMSVMFDNATNFNSDISSWDVSNVSDMWGMFRDASAFNQPLDSWDVSANTRFWRMFQNAAAFNQPLNNWDVSMGEEFAQMFSGASAFNQPLDSWVFSNRCLGSKENNRFFVFEWLVPTANACINSTIDMSAMFQDATAFNQDISTWNVSNVSDMTSMFQDATAFNQDVSAWQIQDGIGLLNMFRDSALSADNYAAILTGWAALSPAATGIDLGIVSTTYCDTASVARMTLIDTHGWSITDLGSSDCVDDSVTARSGGGSATAIGLRQKRLDDLKNSMSSSTAPISEKLATFVTSLKKFLSYLTSHEAEIKNWTPEESKTVIMVLRDALRELLKWLPGV